MLWGVKKVTKQLSAVFLNLPIIKTADKKGAENEGATYYSLMSFKRASDDISLKFKQQS